MPILPLLDRLNRAAIWRRRVHVWGHTVRATSLDRLLCLWLHRTGMMGRADRAFLEEAIRPGMQIVDVGANLGLYTLLLARLAGPARRGYAFEPEPPLVPALGPDRRPHAAGTRPHAKCSLRARPGPMP